MNVPLTVGDQSTTIYFAEPPTGTGPAVLLLHPWWGLNDDVRGLADRLALSGFTVGAPDLFRGKVVSTVEEAEQMVKTFDDSFGEAASTAGLDALLAHTGSSGPVGVVGMSFGAAWAIWLSAQRADVGALVLYYGTWVDDILTKSSAPILGHFAESDPFEDAETVAALEQTCRDAGRPIEVHIYPGTGHWFAEASQDAYVAEAADEALSAPSPSFASSWGDRSRVAARLAA